MNDNYNPISRSKFSKMMWRVPELREKMLASLLENRPSPSGAKGKHWKWTEEQRKRHRQIAKPPSMLGKHHSEETKEKMRVSMKGRHTSPSTEFRKREN